MTNSLKNLFQFMKDHGYFDKYKDYAEYSQKELHLKEKKDDGLKEWKKTLSEEDQEAFDEIFE